MMPVEIGEGDGPVILGQPHGGAYVPDAIAARLNDRGRGLDDTDWHIARLYDGLFDGATVVRANFHRYVIDANRDPAGQSLYPGQNATGLCPTTDFDGRAIWRDGHEPGADEIAERTERWHRPYHDALAAQIGRVRACHGVAILYDCHSIRSDIPFLFDGTLPAFNIGTNNGETCAPAIEQAVTKICRAASDYDTVVSGRFKGGWTTRHHGRPETGTHAIQMELAQRLYMVESPPWTYCDERADAVRAVLQDILASLKQLAHTGGL